MTDLHIDIESFGTLDLRKVGMYRYAEEAEIILFAYTFDHGEPTVIDLLAGEIIPQEVIDAMLDPAVTKWAHNAAFERVEIRECLGIDIPIEQWKCTAVWAAYLGLPRQLDKLSEVLKLGDKAKLKIGKQLITKFCKPRKPTKKNPSTRLMPADDPVNWELFKEYNRQDVVAEMEVHRKFARWPMPDSEWRMYHKDQEINDRGIRVDMRLVNQAIKLASQERETLMARAREITNLDNPNSRDQLLAWLETEDVFTQTLTKKDVEQIIGSTTNEVVLELMTIRQQLAKASVKKYEAVARSVCRDGRIRGTLLFYGAGTGRWCLTGDHEVLTPDGWQPIAQWQGGKIATWNASGQIAFTKASALSFDTPGGFEAVELSSARLAQVSTAEHAMPVLDKFSGAPSKLTVGEMFGKRYHLPITGVMQRTPSEDPDKVRVLVMVQADGHYTDEGHLRLHFKKLRKVERAKQLLRRVGVVHSTEHYGDRVVLGVKKRHQPLWLRMFADKTFGWWFLQEDPAVVFEELEHWDGYRCGPSSIQYSTCNRQNAEIIQALAHTSGKTAVILEKNRQANWNMTYVVNIWLTPGPHHELRKEHQTRTVRKDDKVYCAQTSTGYFLVRRNGKVWVTGNSGQHLQPQNMPSKGLLNPSQIAIAREMLKLDESVINMLFDDTAKVLSSLLRPMLIPSDGKVYAVADFSAIEGRITAWLANETWRLELFARGGKLYETSAERMFNLPPGSVKKGDPMRDKGKVSELALGYQGWEGALITMGALDMGLNLEELAPLASAWREANPAIEAYWYGCEKAAIRAMQNPQVLVPIVTDYQPVGHAGYLYDGHFLRAVLPNGRELYYAMPKLGRNKRDKLAVSYWGVDSKTKKWAQQWLYGGLMLENICQAVARDCLVESLIGFDKETTPVVFHVHDELIAELENPGQLEDLLDVMAKPLPWAPGLLLKGDGYTTEYYFKED